MKREQALSCVLHKTVTCCRDKQASAHEADWGIKITEGAWELECHYFIGSCLFCGGDSLQEQCTQCNIEIAGLQVTSRRPCWWSKTKAFLSAGKWTLFWCKFFPKISFVLTTNMAALSRGCKPRIGVILSPPQDAWIQTSWIFPRHRKYSRKRACRTSSSCTISPLHVYALCPCFTACFLLCANLKGVPSRGFCCFRSIIWAKIIT